MSPVHGSTFSKPLIIVIPPNTEVNELERILAKEDASTLRSVDSVVFQLPWSLAKRIIADAEQSAREMLVKRAPSLDIGMVTYAEDTRTHKMWHLQRPLGTVTPCDSSLSVLRDAALRRLLDPVGTADCHWIADEAHHFVTPSNRHTKHFIRVADTLNSPNTLDQYAFWLLPELSSADLVLGDTWGIVAIIIRALQMLKSDAVFDCFQAHPSSDRARAESTVRQLILRGPPRPVVKAIVSVTASGSAGKTIRRLFEEFGVTLEGDAVVNLFSIGSGAQDTSALCRIELDDFVDYAEDPCDFCKNGSVPILIDSHGYFLRATKEEPRKLTRRMLERQEVREIRAALELIRGTSALSVHRTDPNDCRHHAFHIDVEVLLGQPQFREALLAEAATLTKPDTVLAPDHDAAHGLVDVLRQQWDFNVVFANRVGPGAPLAAEDSWQLSNSKHLLIIDDVVNTGSRIERFIDGIRRASSSVQTVEVMVGVARTSSLKDFRAIPPKLWNTRWSHRFVPVLRVIVPDWREQDCPWCAEVRLLEKVSARIAEPPKWLTRRVGELRSKDGGKAPLLMLNDSPSPCLGSGSFLCNEGADAIEVAFQASAALQYLRTDEQTTTRLAGAFPIHSVFAASNLANYNEALLRATFLRVVRPDEWGVENKAALDKALLEYVQAPDHEVILGEYLVALGRGILRPPSRRFFRQVFEERLEGSLPYFEDELGVV